MNESESATSRREALMDALAVEGASRCGYSGGDPAQWVKGPCDCKWKMTGLGRQAVLIGAASEQTGCCEIRAAWRVLAVEMAGTAT